MKLNTNKSTRRTVCRRELAAVLEPDRSTENRFVARNIAHKMIFSRNSGVAEETNYGACGVVD